MTNSTMKWLSGSRVRASLSEVIRTKAKPFMSLFGYYGACHLLHRFITNNYGPKSNWTRMFWHFGTGERNSIIRTSIMFHVLIIQSIKIEFIMWHVFLLHLSVLFYLVCFKTKSIKLESPYFFLNALINDTILVFQT